MKTKEFNLSKRMYKGKSGILILSEDVKEFIRRLKDNKCCNKFMVREIDKLAGSKLIEK